MERFIDLFAGIGGFHVALKQQGLNCVFASEINKPAADAYEMNFGMRPQGDITQIKAYEIPAHDILCAGFPCQSFSVCGKRDGFESDKGLLFYEIIRIAAYHRPRIMLLENVKNILRIDDGEVLQTIYKELANIGYKVQHIVLNNADYGMAQSRLRVYFVAIRKDVDLVFRAPPPSKEKAYLQDCLLSDSETESLIIKNTKLIITKPEPQPLQHKIIKVGHVNKSQQGSRIYSPSGLSITLTANGGGQGHRTGLYLVNGKVRRLHIEEAKTLMGFERSHIVSRAPDGYRQLGNAVSPVMIKNIYQNIGRD